MTTRSWFRQLFRPADLPANDFGLEKENLMRHSSYATDRQDPIPATIAVGNGEGTRAVGRRRFSRGTGFWLGGIVLGAGGCLFGASMPYHHPVGVVVSVLWWGLYCGCFGMSLGALLGLWAEQRPAFPSQRQDGAGKPPAAANRPIAPADDSGIAKGASRATGGGPGLPAMSRRARAPGR
jgi:hypothetical protein